MALRATISGTIKTRRGEQQAVSKVVDFPTRITNVQNAYDELVIQLTEDNELGLPSGVHIYRDLVVSIKTR